MLHEYVVNFQVFSKFSKKFKSISDAHFLTHFEARDLIWPKLKNWCWFDVAEKKPEWTWGRYMFIIVNVCTHIGISNEVKKSHNFICLQTNSLKNREFLYLMAFIESRNHWKVQLSLLIPEFLNSRFFTNFWWNSLLLLCSHLIPEFPNSQRFSAGTN